MIKLFCQYCGVYCGQRPDEIVFRMAKGARIDIEATCAECNNPQYDCKANGSADIEQLMSAFGMKK